MNVTMYIYKNDNKQKLWQLKVSADDVLMFLFQIKFKFVYCFSVSSQFGYFLRPMNYPKCKLLLHPFLQAILLRIFVAFYFRGEFGFLVFFFLKVCFFVTQLTTELFPWAVEIVLVHYLSTNN